MISKIEWEVLEDLTVEPDKDMCTISRVERARVPGGWLVRGTPRPCRMSSVEAGNTLLGGKGVGHGVGVGVGLTFMPDPEHTWSP